MKKEVWRLSNDEKEVLRVCLEYLRRKLTWTIIKEETGFYDRKVDRTLKKLLGAGILTKTDKYYKINENEKESIRELLEHNKKKDSSLYSLIPQLSVLLLVLLVLSSFSLGLFLYKGRIVSLASSSAEVVWNFFFPDMTFAMTVIPISWTQPGDEFIFRNGTCAPVIFTNETEIQNLTVYSDPSCTRINHRNLI